MNGFFSAFAETFSSSPVQVLAILVLLPLFLVMLYEHRSLKKNQLSNQLERILRREKNKGFVEEVTDAVSEYLGKKSDEIQLKLERSNILFKKEEYLLFMVAGVIGGALVGLVIFPLGGMFMGLFGWIKAPLLQLAFARGAAAIAFGALGYFLPEGVLRYRMLQRRKMLLEQIEDALLNMADALRSGTNIYDAVRITGEELKYPLGDEFARASQEIKAGKAFVQAMEDLKQRVDLQDFTIAMNAIQIQFETGSSLEPLLRDMVKIIGERKILKKEIDKAVTQSKSTGIILMVAPILFVLLFSKMNGEAYVAMLHSGIGIAMIAIGAVAYLLGAGFILYIIRDISKIA